MQSMFKSVEKVNPHVGCIATLHDSDKANSASLSEAELSTCSSSGDESSKDASMAQSETSHSTDEAFLVSLGAALREDLLPKYGVVVVRNLQDLEPVDVLKILEACSTSIRNAQGIVQDRRVESVFDVAKKLPFCEKDVSGVKGWPMVRCLGNMDKYAFDKYGAEKPQANKIGKEWHVDGPGITAIYGKKLEYSSELKKRTLFTSQVRMLDLLTDADKALARRLEGVYGPKHMFEGEMNICFDKGARMNAAGTRLEHWIPDENLTPAELQEKLRLNYVLPENQSQSERTLSERKDLLKQYSRYSAISGTVAKKHPYNGEVGIWTVPSMLECFYDPATQEFMDPLESQLLLERWMTPGVNECYTHVWEEGDLVIFDNLKVMHSTDTFPEIDQLLFQVFLRCGQGGMSMPYVKDEEGKKENDQSKLDTEKDMSCIIL